MPLYDYRCLQCECVSEVLTSASAQCVCPACGSEHVERLVSTPAAPGRSQGLVRAARTRAEREGHFSNYARSERPRS